MATTFLDWLVTRNKLSSLEANRLHDRVVEAALRQVHTEIRAEVAKGERDLSLSAVELRGAIDRELIHRFPAEHTAWRAYRRINE